MRPYKYIDSLEVLAVSGAVAAADKTGNFWLGGGAGAMTCPEYVRAIERVHSYGINTVRYVNDMQGFTMYLLGFQTGYNMSTPDTHDIFPEAEHGDDYALLAWIENYCRGGSGSRFADGVMALARDRYPKRTS